jgi:hypothetical protein
MAKVRCVSFPALLVLSFLGSLSSASADSESYPSATAAAASDLLNQASDDLDGNKTDEALSAVDAALQLDPHNSRAYELRGSVYIQMKLWERAESDYAQALALDPSTIAYKYKLAEIRFLQRDFDVARTRFLALRNDPGLGDLATYKVFLCDLLSLNEGRAENDLKQIDSAPMNGTEPKPSSLYAKAVWDIFHHKPQEADKILASAATAFGAQTGELYLSDLKGFNDLHAPVVSFVTRNGVAYNLVRAFVEDAGLRVSTTSGWVSVPFDQLPDDLSSFPLDLRGEIAAKRESAPQVTTASTYLTFTTKKGEAYDHVKWSMEDAGLRVMTPEGWTNIPLEELPDDLSNFPEELRERIWASKPAEAATTPDTALLTFTTKKGKTYEQVKWLIDDDGLHVLTSDGWTVVPWTELPDDLSPFPLGLREQILRKQKTTPSVAKPASVTPPSDLGERETKAEASIPQVAPEIDPAQFNLYPPSADDCHFGGCLALEGSTLVVGSSRAIYIYKDLALQARLCPVANPGSPDPQITSVSLSGNTLVAGTSTQIDLWMETPLGWKLQATLGLANASTVAVDGDHLVAATNGGGASNDAVSFFTRRDAQWLPVSRSTNHDADTYSADLFGHLVALKGLVAALGLPNWNKSATDNRGPEYSGRVFLEEYDGKVWREQTQLTASEPEVGANQFGESVALSDDQLAVSSANRDLLDYAPHHGSVYLFERTAQGWREAAKIVSPTPANDEEFGRAPIALSRRTLAIGDPGVNVFASNLVLDNGQSTGQPGEIKNAGAVYVYENQVLQAKLLAPDPVDNLSREGSPDHFARSLALDGDELVVGAGDKDGGTGAVYVWRRSHDQWQLKSELKGFHKQADFNY